MILSDIGIKAALSSGDIVIDPAPAENQYTTSALDLMLGDHLYQMLSREDLEAAAPQGVQPSLVIDARNVDVPAFLREYSRPLVPERNGSVIFPCNRLVISQTRERITLPTRAGIAARVEGRSTLARLGLVIHLTAPVIHAGFSGVIVLEMYHVGPHPLRLWPGQMPICQLVFERLEQLPGGEIRTTYQGQTGPR
jgi:dCTP deaminase